MSTRPLPGLPRWLVIFVALVVAADTAAVVIACCAAEATRGDLLLFGALVTCGAVTVEMTRRWREPALLAKDVCGVWELPMVILLPPLFALIAPILRITLQQWRVRKVAVHRRVFTAAVISLSYGAAFLAFRGLRRIAALSPSGADGGTAARVLVVAACFAVAWAVNNCLILPAVKSSDRGMKISELVFARESILNDLTEASVATVVTLAIAAAPVAIVFALPFVTLLQRSSRHAQLVDASRVDAMTGLLNAMTWRRESESEVARAARTGSALAVALIDVDYFKAVNDTYGHQAGDAALGAIARTLQALVRECDLVGRLGGEEFGLFLPQTDGASACIIADRVCTSIAGLRIDPTVGAADLEPIALTVSVGVAVLGGTGKQLTELVAAADAALYRAKGAGRNQAWVTTDTASFSVTGQEASEH